MKTISPKNRLYFLDWLRVIAFGLLVFYHTGLVFVDWGFHIQNDSFSESMKLPMLFLNQWRLPLLFFVSGAGVCFALGTRSPGVFAWERFTRIFLPLLFGMLVVIPPQVYFEWLHRGKFEGSYWEFYPVFFDNITWNHLWFLTYLLVYTFLALPLFLLLRNKKNSNVLTTVSIFLSRQVNLIILVIPLFLTEIFLRPYWHDTRNLVSDWYNFVFYALIFVYGYFFAVTGSFWNSLESRRTLYLALGLFSFCIIYFGWHQPGKNFLETFAAGKYIFDFLKCLNILTWIFCLLGYACHYLAYDNYALQYANKAVYPFYILHQTVLIGIAFYVVQFDWNITSKYLLIVAGTFLITMMVYELVLRRTKFIGFLFGIKYTIRK